MLKVIRDLLKYDGRFRIAFVFLTVSPDHGGPIVCLAI